MPCDKNATKEKKDSIGHSMEYYHGKLLFLYVYFM